MKVKKSKLVDKTIEVPLLFKGGIGPDGHRFAIGTHPDITGNPDIVIAKRNEEGEEVIPTGNFPDDFDPTTDTVEAEMIIHYKITREMPIERAEPE